MGIGGGYNVVGGGNGYGRGRLMRRIGGGGGGGGDGGDGRGGGGGDMSRGPQSPQSWPYWHEAPIAPGPPSWQTPLWMKGHTSSQICGGGGAGDGEGGGAGGGGGDGGGGGGGDGGGGEAPLPHAQQLCDGTPKSGAFVHSCPAIIEPP
jgi:hypothetical protein